ncbi:hypothetical protein ACF0H5_003744 [Mactra antiquata]
MGLADGYEKARFGTKVALMLLAAATIFVWIALSCTGWIRTTAAAGKYEGFQVGLWRICDDAKLSPTCIQLDGWGKVWFNGVQGFVSLGFIGINVAFLLVVLFLFVSSCQKNREIAMATTVVCVISGLLYLSGVVIFGAKFDEDYIEPYSNKVGKDPFKIGYCFGLSIVAIVFELIAGCLIYLDSKKDSQNTRPSNQNEIHNGII